MSWDAARAALDARLLALAGIDPTRIAWPGRTFTPPASGIWYKVAFIPATAEPEKGGANHEKGIYQVSIFACPGPGIGPLLQAADTVVSHFSRRNLSGVACNVAVPGPVLQEPDRLHLPVSIPFQVL